MTESSVLDVDTSPPAPLCEACKGFVDGLIAWGFKEPSDLQSAPPSGPSSRWGRSEAQSHFEHYGTPEEIIKSAESCSLCRLILDLFEPGDVKDMTGLILRPWHGRGHGWPQTHGIRTQLKFKDTFARTDNYRPEPVRLLRVSRILPYTHPVPEEEDKKPYFERDVPESAMSQDCLNTIRVWFKDCAENHPKCHPVGRSSVLPTRVIDIGIGADDMPVLYVSRGEKAPYAALSHCWGGYVPLKTTKENLDAYRGGLPAHQLPRNFQDAILVTRVVGLRYLWIDALCIIQDDPEDWAAEAERMAATYRSSALTISALNAAAPDAGFLGPRAQKSVLIANPGRVVINSFRQGFSDAMEESILSTRAWCMQERLLSRVILHFGRDQMYWECCTNTAEENRGSSVYNQERLNKPSKVSYQSGNHRTPAFADARKEFHVSGPENCWLTAVEEYSHRNLTFRRDKLIAIAGIANLVRAAARSKGGACSYIAGHFMGGGYHFVSSLFWSARLKLLGEVKLPDGTTGMDVLTRSDDNYPSWSWASVDGDVEFHGFSVENDDVELLDVKVTVGFDDVMAERVEARLKLRAAIIKAPYNPAWRWLGEEIAGTIFPIASCVVLDVDRFRQRDYWILPTETHGILVMDEVKPRVFRRVGWAKHEEPPPGLVPHLAKIRYLVREFELI
ncbi:hypothetical protein MAPG_03162 [Magnaporthiopsis poae ATCC 64411]|uniref:Heterokaryon incompatibility domain-containing protein n=1 Tax=Magnaporthiopsis poae (strain ATCC 64411 / 73-15) TaxID=644358 RepID=A0A0C4DTA2_MAGP6|nr:hypothetical protein MAPG_03162 [Magnaporthiopsis poae ATCC 64411]